MRTQHKDIQDLYKKGAVAKLYEETRFTSFQGKLMHMREVETVNTFLKKNRPQKILEIATGTGRITRELKGFKTGVGIDSSSAMLDELRKNLKDKKWSFKIDDALKLSFKKNTFDAVVTFRLIRHFVSSYREQSYSEIYRVLKPGGLFIFDALNKQRGFFGALADFGTWCMERVKGYRRKVYDVYFTKAQLRKEIKAAGFDILAIVPINSNYPLWCLYTFIAKFPGITKWANTKFYKALAYERHRPKAQKPFSWVIIARKP